MGGTGWRRAFCTSIPQDSETLFPDKQSSNESPSASPSPRCRIKFGFLSSSSNPSTPKSSNQSTPKPSNQSTISTSSLRCRTTPREEAQTKAQVQAQAQDDSSSSSPKLQCRTPRLLQSSSNPSSPRTPSRFALLKTSLGLSRNRCGICMGNVRRGQGTAIFTAECSHAFHFPCIAAHVTKHGNLVCPVCNTHWREVPLLPTIATHHSSLPQSKSKSKSNHLYNDDEPLLSPRFNPIPEEEQEQEEDDENEKEFQGFFVNPHHSPQTHKMLDIKLLSTSAVVSVGRAHETYAVALRIKAPPPPPPPAHNTKAASKLLDPGRRAPIDLVTVLDTSMTGDKLQMLKRAMRLVISSLTAADRLSIIAFAATPKRLLPLRRMTTQGQISARRVIDRLVCTQGSSASEALRKATKVIEDRRERNPVASIMLLSDGQDGRSRSRSRSNSNSSNSPRDSGVPTRFSHLEIPVHSFGFGDNSEDAFAKCVGGLLSVVVQDLRLQLGFASGEITAVYSCNGRPTLLGSGSVRLGDLYAEEERELLVELRVPAMPVGAHHVMTIRSSYKNPVSQELIQLKEQALLVPRPHAVRSSDPKIERLRNLFVTNRAIAEARRCVEHNDVASAYKMLISARGLVKQVGSISADEYVEELDMELNELQYRLPQQAYTPRPQIVIHRRRNATEHENVAFLDENGEPLTPSSAWRAAEKLAKVAIMRKSMNKVGDLHGFENARF